MYNILWVWQIVCISFAPRNQKTMRHETYLTDILSEVGPGLGIQGRCYKPRNLYTDSSLKPNIEYLVTEEADRSFGLWVNTVGQQIVKPDMTYPLKNHPEGYFFNVRKGRILDEFQLVYITDGSGSFFAAKNERGG